MAKSTAVKKQKEKTPANESSMEEDLQAEILLKEADDALHNEKLQALWKEWGSTIIGMALMLVFGTMVGVGWRSWQASVESEGTNRLVSAMQGGNLALLKASEGQTDSYAALAALLAAGEFAAAVQNNNEAVVNIIKDTMARAKQADLPGHYDVLARWADLRIRTETGGFLKFDDMQKIADQMESLAAEDDHPYAAPIYIETAALYGEKLFKPEKSLEVLDKAAADPYGQNNRDLQKQISDLKRLYTHDQQKNKGRNNPDQDKK